MHQLGLTLAVLAVAVFPSTTFACKCVNWNAAERVAESEAVLYVEVLKVGLPERVSREEADLTFAVVKFPVSMRVLEALKGSESAAKGVALVGPPSSCELSLKPGDRLAIMLRKSQASIGYCDAVSSPRMLDELRAASRKQ